MNTTEPFNKSTLVQVMSCCHQATSHYLSQLMLTEVYVVTMVSPGHNESKMLNSKIFYPISFTSLNVTLAKTQMAAL